MKRKVFATIFIALILVLSFGLTACNKRTPSPVTPDPEISLDVTDARLDVYETLRITATTANTDAAVEWSSSDTSIATVDGGLVSARSEGTATVTAKVGNVSATCAISVYNSWVAPVLTVDYSQISVAKGGDFTVEARADWKGNDITSSVTYDWALVEGENAAIAEIAANGNKATFTGKEYGNAEFVVFATVNDVPLVQTVNVKVCNADIVFDIENLEKGVGGYSARLALLKRNDNITEIIPQITVSDADGVVDGAAARMDWRVEGDAQAVVRDEQTGKISAAAEGKAQVIGTYENVDLVIDVTVYRPQISIDGTAYFETSKLLPKTKGVVDPAKPAESGITLTGLVGTVKGAKLGNADIFSSFDASKSQLVINKSNLNTDKNILGKRQTLKIDTDKAIYDIDAKVVTLAIRTPDDLDSIAEVSADESQYWALKNDSTTEYAPYYWDGYYVLANDIDYTADQDGREFVTFIDLSSLGIVKNPDHTGADWVDGRYLGFRGTFDGQGYNIDNFKLKNVDTGGIFGVMATDGVFRNVSFTNAVNPGGTGFICSAGDGTIENVYIQCSSQTGGWDNNRSGMFYTRDIINTAAVKNVFVDTRLTYNVSNTAGDGWIYAFGYAYPSSANYRGVYCVGTERAYAVKPQGGTWVDNIYGAYNTYTDLRNGGVNFDEWAGDFWTIANGFPYPKNLELPAVDTTNAKTSITTRSDPDGDTVVVTVDKYAIVTLDAESILAGVKLLGIEQPDSGLQQLEFAPVDEDRTVSITVKSAFDPTDSGTKYNVELKVKSPAGPLEDPRFDGFEGTGNAHVMRALNGATTELSTDVKHSGQQSMKTTVTGMGGGYDTIVITLDTDMQSAITGDRRLMLWVYVAEGNCVGLTCTGYKNEGWLLDHSCKQALGAVGNGEWKQILFTAEQTRTIKSIGSISVCFEKSGDNDLVAYVDDLELVEDDVNVTVSAEDMTVKAGEAAEIAAFGGAGFDANKLTVTRNGAAYTEYTISENKLSFTPSAAGEYVFAYTHKNGHLVKTSTQTVTAYAPLEDPCFDGFEGTGNRTVLEAKGDTNEYKLSDEDKLNGSKSLKVTVKNFVSVAIRLDTSMQQAITASSQLSLWIKVADRATTNLVASAYNAADPSLLGSGRIGLGVVQPGSWRQIIFTADATQDIKNIGAITLYIEFGGQNVGNVFVDDLELVEDDGSVTVSAEDMTVKAGEAAEIAAFGGSGFDANKLTVTLNGAAYTDYTISGENKLSFTPSAAGEYVFAYTHKNGHAVKTATQTVTAYVSLEDPYFDGFEGTGNAHVMRALNGATTELSTDVKHSGQQSMKTTVTGMGGGYDTIVITLDTDMQSAITGDRRLMLWVYVAEGNCVGLTCTGYKNEGWLLDHSCKQALGAVGNGEWKQILFTAEQTRTIKSIGSISVCFEKSGDNDLVAYVDDLELVEDDGNVTVSAEDMTVKAGEAAEIATFGGAGFDANKLTVTRNGAAYTDYTISENKLSFTPSAAGEYVFAYTHKNGHLVKTATQTVTAYAPLEDPYFDGFEGTGNAYKLRNNHNPINIGLTTEEKRSGNQSLKIEVTENRTATVWHLDTDMIEALENSSQLVLYIKTSATVVCSAYNGNESTTDDLLAGNRAEVEADNGGWRKVSFWAAAVKDIAAIGAITLYIEFGGTNSGVAYIDDVEAQKPLVDPAFDGFEGLGNSYVSKTGTVGGDIASWELSREEKRSGDQSLKLNIPQASSIVLKIDADMINAIGADSQLSFWLKAPNADSTTIGIYKGGDNWNLGSDRITSSETDGNGWQKYVFGKGTTQKIKSDETADNSITLYFEFSSPGVAYVDDLQLIEAE